MLFTTPAQWLVLGLALVAGWLLGLASHPGGRRWRERYAVERDAHAATRRDLEARAAAADQRAKAAASTEDPKLVEANQRIAALERDNARMAKLMPVTAATVSRPYVPPLPAQTARPASDRMRQRGWFDWDRRA